MKLVLVFFACILLFSANSKKSDKVDMITINIEGYKHVQNGAFHHYLSLTCSDGAVDYISDFDFEWGYTYTLKVQRTKLSNPPMDVGDTDYKLIKITEKTPVADSMKFDMLLVGCEQLGKDPDEEGALVFNADGTCTYLREMIFMYPVGLESELKSLNKTDKYSRSKFMFVNGKIQLISL